MENPAGRKLRFDALLSPGFKNQPTRSPRLLIVRHVPAGTIEGESLSACFARLASA